MKPWGHSMHFIFTLFYCLPSNGKRRKSDCNDWKMILSPSVHETYNLRPLFSQITFWRECLFALCDLAIFHRQIAFYFVTNYTHL